jgi:hypothetical protein
MEIQRATQKSNGKIAASELQETETPLFYNPDFDLDFVERLLGRQKRDELPQTTRQRLHLQQGRLQDLIRPRIIWKEFGIAHADKSGVTLANGVVLQSRKMAWAMKDASGLIGFIATVGKQIDREIESLMDGGALVHSYIADALGSGAVESLADRFHSDMARMSTENKRSVGLRFSPGYCDWQVTEQQKLFSLLDSKVVGVKLADSCLMTPRKSISGVFGVFDNANTSVENKKHNPCRQCGKKDCIARRVEAVPPSHLQ